MSKLEWRTLTIDESEVKDGDEYIEDTIARLLNENEVQSAIVVDGTGFGTKIGFNFYVEFLVLAPIKEV